MTREPPEDPSSSGSLRIAALDSIAALRRVLIVDDNDDFRRQLVAFFTERGWHVESTRTLSSALKLAAQLLPHVIISELILPDVRGRFADQYRQVVTREVTIIGVTRMSPVLFAHARNTGFDDVLGKPVDLDALHRRIESALEAALSR